ncbi:MAG: hypothetical protein ACP5Q1_11845 [Anaerolineae bacterium]
MSKQKEKVKSSSPPGAGLVVAALFWLWSAVLFCAPVYLNLTGYWRTLLYVLGSIFLAISFARAGLELARAFKNRAFCYWGLGMLFTSPAAVLHVITLCNSLPFVWTFVLRLLVLVLLSIGGAFLLYGFPYLLWNPKEGVNDSDAHVASPEAIMTKAEKRG